MYSENTTEAPSRSIGMGQQAEAVRTEPSIMDALMSALVNLEMMASELSHDLRRQADRLIGPEPTPPEPGQALDSANPSKGAPTFMAVEMRLSSIRDELMRARGGARRLSKIG